MFHLCILYAIVFLKVFLLSNLNHYLVPLDPFACNKLIYYLSTGDVNIEQLPYILVCKSQNL